MTDSPTPLDDDLVDIEARLAPYARAFVLPACNARPPLWALLARALTTTTVPSFVDFEIPTPT